MVWSLIERKISGHVRTVCTRRSPSLWKNSLKLCFFPSDHTLVDFPSPFQVLYWLDDIQCKGDEESLLDCDHAAPGDHNCGDHEIAAVSCK